MAKKNGVRPASNARRPRDDSAGKLDRSEDPVVDESPEVQAAEEAVHRAEQELKNARALYEQVRQQATDRLKQVREKTVGEVIDGTLKLVKRYPGPGVLVAALLGFFLGRLFRR
jgi:ElaB/YqjD/DUF883 family membrane-anchored ribosome-binding protein